MLTKSFPHAKITCAVDPNLISAGDARIAARKMDQVYAFYLGQCQFFKTRATQLVKEVASRKKGAWEAVEELTKLQAAQQEDMKKYAALIEGHYSIEFMEREAGDERGFQLLTEAHEGVN
jgi:hypothetical protein